MRKLVMLLVIATLAACKKDDEKKSTPRDFIPVENKKYIYEVADGNGTGHLLETKVMGSRDSAGLRVYSVRSALKDIYDNRDTSFINSFVKDGFTTEEFQLPSETALYYRQASADPSYYDIVLEGFPVRRHFPNKPDVNSVLRYEGGPLKFAFKRREGVEIATFSLTSTFHSGRMIGMENVTTEAGIFICSKWVYEYETHLVRTSTRIPEGMDIKSFGKDTLWLKTGVGVIKSAEWERADDDELLSHSTTILKKIE